MVTKPKKKATKKRAKPVKKGRPRVCLEFIEARELVRGESLDSVGQYKKWWLHNNPARIPKRPDRAYKKEWLGWNNFLGSSNPFPCVKRSFRSYVEAKSFVHRLGLRNKPEWFDYVRTKAKPVDIPTRPDLIYTKDWFTWKDFLGSDLSSVKRNMDAAGAIFFINQNHGSPSNVYHLGITLEGKLTILQHQAQQGFRIIGLFACDIDFDWESIVHSFGKEYWGSNRGGEYTIININEFIFNITDFVVPIKN